MKKKPINLSNGEGTLKMKDKENNEKRNNIILFPDFGKRKDEVEKLRTELSERLYEYDELRFVICKNI